MGLGKLVKDELSGSGAKSYVAGLTKFHRIQGSPMMRQAADHVKNELEAIGVDEVSLEEWPADGKRKYWAYTSVIGWSVRSAELRMVEPRRDVLARFSEVPQSLHTHSASTPKGGVTAELVDVGKGVSDNDYVKKNVRGKIVLATGKARLVQHQSVIKRGALGVVTDSLAYEFPGVRESMDVPDAHSYQGIWPNAKDASKIGFGFSLSKRQGNELRKYLHGRKKVMLHAEVDARLSPGKYAIVTARIRGSENPDDEIFLVSHLCHPKPGANDNASGSGLLIEIARTMTSLIESGKIKRPKRSIRFLWVPETVGTVVYLSEHPEMHDRFKAGVNLDMVGEDQELCKSTLSMDSTPDSLPSYLNDFVYTMIARANTEYDSNIKLGIASNYRYGRTAFTGGSDHAEFNESTVGAPCVSLTQWPDRFYHTSMDTLDKVSEDSLRRVGWAAAMSVLTLADADTHTLHRIASLTCSEGIKRISEAVAEASAELIDAKDRTTGSGRSADDHRSRLRHIIQREIGAVKSLSRLDEEMCSDEFVGRQIDALENHGLSETDRLEGVIRSASRVAGKSRGRRATKTESAAGKIIPRRRFKGTIDEDAVTRVLGYAWFRWYSDAESRDSDIPRKMYEMTCLMDGKRSLKEIVEFVSAEYGLTSHDDAFQFIEYLKKAKLVSY